MSEPETITLPKSGLVLTWTGRFWKWEHDGIEFSIEGPELHGGLWCAYWTDYPADPNGTSGTREECIAWLDARAMELRSALLPPGAVVVTPGEDTVEIGAQALFDSRDGCSDPAESVWSTQRESRKDFYRVAVRAILGALGVTNAG